MTVGVSLLYAPFLGVAREDAALGSFEQPIDSAYVLRPSLRVAVHHPINAATRFTYGLRLGPEFLRLRAVGEQGEADSAVTLMALAFSEFDVALDLQVADRIWLGPFGAASVGMYSMSYADGEFRVVTDSMDAFERTHLWFATGLRGAFVL